MARKQQIHSPARFEAARRLISYDRYIIHKAAKVTGIPYTTLRDHVNGEYVGYDTQFGPKRLLTTEEEESLASYIKFMALRGVPLARDDVRRFAKDIVSQRQPIQSLSDKWLRSFLKGHSDLTIRKAHLLQQERVSVTQDIVNNYFVLLLNTLNFLGLKSDPTRIFNCDESGFSGTMTQSKKVVVPKGTRHAYQSVISISGHITMLNAISAAGQTLPPLLIFSQVLPKNCKDGVPDSWQFRSTESGYINSELFLEWFNQCFIPHIGQRRPVLLILDNHASHISKSFIDAAKHQQVDLLYIPAHSSHMLQPQDAGYFHVVKQRAAELAMQMGYLGMKMLPHRLFPQILLQALNKIAGNTVSTAFRCTGIYPYNPLSVKALLPSKTELESPCASSTAAQPSSTSTCTCGSVLKQENNLVKLGIVASELADILLEPVTDTKQSKPRKRTYKSARVILSNHSMDEQIPGPAKVARKKYHYLADPEPAQPVEEPIQPDDPSILCQVCMIGAREGFFWVGCDQCEKWYHYECLPAYVQTDVDLSLVISAQWHCGNCPSEE